MAMLVASEVTLFGTFIGSYYYLRFENAHWPPPGSPEPRVAVPLIMVGILVATSLPMLLAARAVRRGRLWTTRLLLVAALAVQCGYLVWAIHDYVDQLKLSAPQDNAYSSWQRAILAAAGLLVVVSEAAAVTVFLATRETNYGDGPPGEGRWGGAVPYSRLHFFAMAAMVANVLFLAVILLDGLGSVFS